MKELIIKLLGEPHHNLLSADEIYHDLDLKTLDDYDELGNALLELEKEFIIMHNKQNKFALIGYFNLAKGIIRIKDAGFGFVDMDSVSIHISEYKLETALSGDEVLVRFFKSTHEGYEGEVVRIIKRNTTFLIGELIKNKKKFFVKASSGKNVIWAKVKNATDVLLNKIVKISITKYYSFNTVEGEIMEVIGNANDIGMDITMNVVTSNVKCIFDEDTMLEAHSLPQMVDVKMYMDRQDLTNEIIITIDGDNAKDFDDAVRVEILPNQNYLLKVCIADVSEYVKENSPLDKEAFERGTSIYLPDRVIPMLPVELSNGICSLNEGVVRLVMVVELEINQKGEIINANHYEALIKSRHRMTYSDVNKMIEDHDQALIEKYQDIYPMLEIMQELAQILYEKRIKKGAFDFETAEACIILDEQGCVNDIILRERRSAEKLIEEFMLIANESVAEKMTWLDVPFIYRVHDEPEEERLNLFITRIKSLKQEFKYKNKASLPKALQQLLLDTNDENNPLEKTLKSIISNTLIRTMSKAKYQEQNIGHYGLASKCYTHFTSPIRRYPDLLVHRLMKQFLFNKPQLESDNPYEYFTKKVHDTGITASLREKSAENLERITVDMKKCEYMEKYIGNIFTGMISSVVNWGLYVTLDNTVEGLVRFENMPRDYYEVDEKKGIIYGNSKNHTYRLGDIVKIKVIDIDASKHQITFKLIGKIKNEI